MCSVYQSVYFNHLFTLSCMVKMMILCYNNNVQLLIATCMLTKGKIQILHAYLPDAF